MDIEIAMLCNRLEKLMDTVPEQRLSFLSMKNDETGLKEMVLDEIAEHAAAMSTISDEELIEVIGDVFWNSKH